MTKGEKIRKMKKLKGITLITLVITIVLMLIIAGVSISVIVDDGLFDNAKHATGEYEKESLIEIVKTAESYLETYNALDYTKKIDIDSLIDKILDISDINTDDYFIQKDTNSASIINKKTGVGVEIVIDASGKVVVGGMKVDDTSDLENMSKPIVTYALSPEEETNDEVTITVTVTETTSGIARTKLEGQTENTYTNKTTVTETYKVTKAGKYTYEAEGNNGRITIVEIIVQNAVVIANSSTAIGVSYDVTAPTRGNVKVTFTDNSKEDNLTLKYQIGSTEGTWKTYTGPVEMSANGKVYARLFDKKDRYKGLATATVANIDRVAPIAFNIKASATTYTITVELDGTEVQDAGSPGTAPGNIGVRGYQYKLMDQNGNVIVDWTPETSSTRFTFDLDVINAQTGNT